MVTTLSVGQLQTNCYLLFDQKSRKGVVIDPGDEADFIIRKIADLDIQPQLILATHGHFDHVLAALELKLAYRIPFYLGKGDLPILKRTQSTARYFTGLEVDPPSPVDGFLTNKQMLAVGKLKLKVISTPGHTPGSVSFYCAKLCAVFSGDLLFVNGGVGRTDLRGGDSKALKLSIKKILQLPAETKIYPGHGPVTTVKNEESYH